MFPAQRNERLHRRRIHRLVAAFVAARLVLQRGKLAAPVPVKPFLNGGGGKKAPIPALLGGRLQGLDQGKAVLARLHHRLHGGKARQRARFPGIII